VVGVDTTRSARSTRFAARDARFPFVKICCITSLEEAQLAIAAGASALGLVSNMPSGPGIITEVEIARIAVNIPTGVESTLLTQLQTAHLIAEQHARCGTSALQLVDCVPVPELRKLRVLLPTVKLIQVVHVIGRESIATAVAVAPFVDALLLDSGNATAPIRELGGTGRTHDWAISGEICRSVDTPVFLAGGLNGTNVASAIRTVQPFGVDVCSGVRSNDRLDSAKLVAFFLALQHDTAQHVGWVENPANP
jgi:phosphoribosylanthranilate isomerase